MEVWRKDNEIHPGRVEAARAVDGVRRPSAPRGIRSSDPLSIPSIQIGLGSGVEMQKQAYAHIPATTCSEYLLTQLPTRRI